MYSFEASSIICDNNGNLLFYTNGDTVWNRNHVMMVNGFDLAGGVHSSATQGAIIIPKPCSNNLYYIFTVTEDESNPHLFSYSIVDITQDAGLGAVITKNVTLHNPVAERLTATLQSNGIDYWVVVQERLTGNLLVYSLTTNGLNVVPIIFNSGGIDPADYGGYIRFSHDGTKLCVSHQHTPPKAILYDFNKTTGVINNPVNLAGFQPWGIEFSPDNSKLYIGSPSSGNLYQYDLSAGSSTAIQNSRTVISGNILSVYGPLKLAPDGKIYVARSNDTYLGIIEHPNLLGTACNFIFNAVDLSPGNAVFGLPNNLDLFSGCIPCQSVVHTNMNVTVCSNQTYQLPSGIVVSNAGIYMDTIRTHASCDSIIYTVDLFLSHASSVNATAQICSNQTYELPSGISVNSAGVYYDTIRSQSSCDSIIYTIRLTVNNVSFSNQSDSIYEGENYTLPSSMTVSSAGSYQSILINSLGCDSIIKTVLKLKMALSGCLTLKNAFTPNGDGINDDWILYTSNCFKNLSVTVFNRYGSTVYRADHYKNDWNGRYKNKDLPVGTYYYIITITLFNDKRNVFKGNVTILR